MRESLRRINLQNMIFEATLIRRENVKNSNYQTILKETKREVIKCNIHTRPYMEGETHILNNDGQILQNLTQLTVDDMVDIKEDDWIIFDEKQFSVKSLKRLTRIPAIICILVEKAYDVSSSSSKEYTD
jgi:hypothetical protein